MHVSGEGLEATAVDQLREIVGGCEMPRGDLAFGHAGKSSSGDGSSWSSEGGCVPPRAPSIARVRVAVRLKSFIAMP
ncbi:hypothetical protein WL80_33500 [Burkholderia ubonensis]|nr:hypothetical protein WJ60_08490 [Burkholderia ubonensis]KVZ01746.1 hypothetical protein WL11_19140 [Burkholderia ubonensis]KWE98956.1 hypothetical protein WL80_33500 [Burkholderia ubonensis]